MTPYADEYTLFGCFDRLLQECEDHGLQFVVVQGGADGADAMPASGRPQQGDRRPV